jgi:biopolymer transport protein ExbD
MAADFDPSEKEDITDINITPFVDVVLVLLVIFMVTAPMMVKEAMNIELPKGKSTQALEARTFSIAISKKGQVLIDGEMIDMSLLYDKAVELKQNYPDLQLLISADKESLHGDVIKVLDQVKSAGITNFAFQVEKLTDD